MPTTGGGKPARKPAKRGPTKAAALKALGLTQEDLETIKSIRNMQQYVRPASPNVGEASISPTGGQDPQAALEDRSAPEQKAWDSPDENAEPVWYARNLRNVDVGFRLSRQQAQGEKRTNLKPRGQRGDLFRLETRDLKDPELQMQVGYQLVEVIPEGEALKVINKQYTNATTEVPAHIAMLRNPKGEQYAQADPVKFATDEEAYGITVQQLNPDLMQGKLSDKEIKRDAGFVQNAQHTPTGGNPAIISDGFMAPTQSDGSGADNEKQAQVDAKLRARQFEDRPEDNLGVKVTVEPTQRVR